MAARFPNQRVSASHAQGIQRRDRIELTRCYSLRGEPLPQGVVVGLSRQNRVLCKMDRSGKVVRLDASDLHVIERAASSVSPSHMFADC